MVSRSNLQVFEVLVADAEQVMLMKDDHSAVLMTKAEFEKDNWWTAVKRKERRLRGKNQG